MKEESAKQTIQKQRSELKELRPMRRRVTELEKQLANVTSAYKIKISSLQQELTAAKRAASSFSSASSVCSGGGGSSVSGSVSGRSMRKQNIDRRAKPAYMRGTVSSSNEKGGAKPRTAGSSSGNSSTAARGASRRDHMNKAKADLSRSASMTSPPAAGEPSWSGVTPSTGVVGSASRGVPESDGFIAAPMNSLPTHGGRMSEFTRRSTMMPGDLSRVKCEYMYVCMY
jgi:hypothetical protein